MKSGTHITVGENENNKPKRNEMKYIRKEGEIMPPFYFGLAYRNWMDYSEVYYRIPICYFVQVYKWLRNKWYKFQHIESPNDRIIRALSNEAEKQANGIYLSQMKEAERYRKAYMECLYVLSEFDVPMGTIDKLHNL